VRIEAELGVVFDGFGSGQEEDESFGTERGLGEGDEGTSDALLLIFDVNSEVGEVATEFEVGDGASDADEFFFVPRGAEEVPVAEHGADGF